MALGPAPNRLPRAAWLLAFSLLIAGCAAEAPAPKDTPATPKPGTGRWVVGTVVDEELVPVPAAQVVEVSSGNASSTDAQGRFRLDNVTASAGTILEARHEGFRTATLRVDLLYVTHAEVRFVLVARPTEEPRHVTKESEGEISCQVAFGSHHGFPGFYRRTCAEFLPESKERIQVAAEAGVVAGVVELSWKPQSQFADIMGLTLYISTKTEELMVAAVHSLPGDHYVGVFTGTAPVQPAKAAGGVFDTYVHVDPSALDEHVPTNVGVVVQQAFTLYTTAFYGEPPPPTWSARKA